MLTHCYAIKKMRCLYHDKDVKRWETVGNGVLTDTTAVNVLDLYGAVFVAVDPAAGRRGWATRGRWLAVHYDNAIQRFSAPVGQHFLGSSRRR